MVRYKAAEKSILRTTCAPFNGPTNSSTDSRCRATTICPPPARREIQRSRTPDIYFGDSLSTGSPFKIECLYKSSPIRERVLNARTSPATKTQPEHPPYPPSSFQQPLSRPFISPFPSLHPRLTDSIGTQDLYHLSLCQSRPTRRPRAFLLCILRREIR